jgi:hypothetical protein
MCISGVGLIEPLQEACFESLETVGAGAAAIVDIA